MVDMGRLTTWLCSSPMGTVSTTSIHRNVRKEGRMRKKKWKCRHFFDEQYTLFSNVILHCPAAKTSTVPS
jgi:hypothetical protein